MTARTITRLLCSDSRLFFHVRAGQPANQHLHRDTADLPHFCVVWCFCCAKGAYRLIWKQLCKKETMRWGPKPTDCIFVLTAPSEFLPVFLECDNKTVRKNINYYWKQRLKQYWEPSPALIRMKGKWNILFLVTLFSERQHSRNFILQPCRQPSRQWYHLYPCIFFPSLHAPFSFPKSTGKSGLLCFQIQEKLWV